MIVSFLLPSGESRECWISRHNWLLLIYRLSSPDFLPTTVRSQQRPMKTSEYSGSAASCKPLEFFRSTRNSQVSIDKASVQPLSDVSSPPMQGASRITVFKIGTGFCISFFLEGSDCAVPSNEKEKINMNISPQEVRTLLAALTLKARQAGWDPEAAFERLRTHLRTKRVPLKSAMH